MIPAGTYKITSLFLKSGINVELVKGAELLADTDRSHYAILPGLIESYDETGRLQPRNLGGKSAADVCGNYLGIDVSDVITLRGGQYQRVPTTKTSGKMRGDNWGRSVRE